MRAYLLQHLLENSSRMYPDNVAVVFKEQSLTYSELERQSNELAAKLVRLGVRKGDRVGIMLAKSPETVIAIFGILKTGAMYVPIDPSAPANRAAYIIEHCGIECLVTSHRYLTSLLTASQDSTVAKAILVECVPVDALCAHIQLDYFTSVKPSRMGTPDFCPTDVSDSSPAYILHTSGSTGNPKGVAISHLNALTFINMAADYFAISQADRFCSHAPLHFDLSVFDIFVAVKCGATVVLLPELYSTFPVKLADFIDKERITIWNSVASVLKLLAEMGGLDQHSLASLRIVHFSGDIMPVKYLRVLSKHMDNAAFFNIYGQTEANSSMFYPIHEIPENDSWRIPIGRSFPNFEVFAVNDDHEIIGSAGEEGELYVSSATVALGYWGEESKTSEKFVPDPRNPFLRKIVYKTGDLVRLDEHGDYVFAGRKDHMIKSRGYRIELEEIETVLSGHPEIVAAVAIPIPDELIGNRIAAVIVPMTNSTIRKEELIRYSAARLPRYMVPELMVFKDALPMTSSGKVDRKKLETLVVSGDGNETGICEDGFPVKDPAEVVALGIRG